MSLRDTRAQWAWRMTKPDQAGWIALAALNALFEACWKQRLRLLPANFGVALSQTGHKEKSLAWQHETICYTV